MKRTQRAIAAAAVVALPITLTACWSSDSARRDTTSNAEADAAGVPFGPVCKSVPKDGAGSFEAMTAEPVATAAGNIAALSTLVSAVQDAKLRDTLNSAQDITVFAPTNEAFAAIPEKTHDKAMDDPTGLLTTVLINHVVETRLSPEQVAGEHETLAGGTITITGSGEDFKVGEANAVCGNVQTANATVYIIDRVLLPA